MMQRYTVYFVWKLLYVFRVVPSSRAQTTVSTASGICHTVTAICHYRGRIGTGLSVMWVAYATHITHTAYTTVVLQDYNIIL
jgi:hypothetical protein